MKCYGELNELEQRGLKELLGDNGWHFCNIIDSFNKPDEPAMGCKIGNREITIALRDIHILEE